MSIELNHYPSEDQCMDGLNLTVFVSIQNGLEKSLIMLMHANYFKMHFINIVLLN